MSGVGVPTGQPRLENILRFLNYVHENVNPNDKIISLSGGEPTLWPDLPKFIEQVPSSYQVSMVTNGSRTIRWWETFSSGNLEKLDVVTLSIHLEYADIEHIKKVISLLEPKVRVTCLIIFRPGLGERAKLFYDALKELNVTLFVKPITDRWRMPNGGHKAVEYTAEEEELLKLPSIQRRGNRKYKNKSFMPNNIILDGKEMPHGYPLHLVATRQNRFKGWWCEMGIKRLAIWYDGSIKAALCGTATLPKYRIGNINDDTYNPVMGGICESEWCSCIPDLKIPKWRITDV
jgi:organic radical activating enzyme